MFFMMMLTAFLARVNPVSTIAKPDCMKKNEKGSNHAPEVLGVGLDLIDGFGVTCCGWRVVISPEWEENRWIGASK